MKPRSFPLLVTAFLLSFASYSQGPGSAASFPRSERTDSALFSVAEVREIALLLQQREDVDGEIRIQRAALARLITAHNVLQYRASTCTLEAKALRLALKESEGETAAVAAEGAARVRTWKGRFWITAGVGTALLLTSFYIGGLNP